MDDNLPNDSDGDALRGLISDGSDISKPMLIDFTVSVPGRLSGEAFAELMASRGFTTSVEQDDSSKDWTCYCSITMIPDYQRLIDIQKIIDELGRPHGAYSDGWGSFGNNPKWHQ